MRLVIPVVVWQTATATLRQPPHDRERVAYLDGPSAQNNVAITTTVTIPNAWSCARSYYGDGLCDCGCGAVDADCSSNQASACAKCSSQGSCSSSECPGTILANDNAHCSN